VRLYKNLTVSPLATSLLAGLTGCHLSPAASATPLLGAVAASVAVVFAVQMLIALDAKYGKSGRFAERDACT
jgi:hypothetical protein